MRSFRSQALWVLALVLLSAGVVRAQADGTPYICADPTPPATAEAPPGFPCDPEAPVLLVPSADQVSASLIVADDGGVLNYLPELDRVRVSVTGVARPHLRIVRLRSGAAPVVLGCGPVQDRDVFTLENHRGELLDGDVVHYELWGEQGRAPSLEYTQLLRDRIEVLQRSLSRRAYAERARARLVEGLPQLRRYVESGTGSLLRPAVREVASAQSGISCARVGWGCQGSAGAMVEWRTTCQRSTAECVRVSRIELLADAVCGEMDRDATILNQLERLLRSLLVASSPEAPRGRRAGSEATVGGPVPPGPASRGEFSEPSVQQARELAELWQALVMGANGADASGNDETLAGVRWLSQGEHGMRLRSRAELVYAPTAILHTASYGSTSAEASSREGDSVVVVFEGVPSSVTSSLALHVGDSLETSLEQSVVAAVQLVTQVEGLVATVNAGSVVRTMALTDPPPPPLTSPWEVVLEGHQRVLLPPMAATTVRSTYARNLSSRRQHFMLCEGARCIREGAERNVRSELRVDPWPTVNWIVGVGFGMGTRVASDARPVRFEPVGGTTGPDQLFELRHYGTPLLPSLSVAVGLSVDNFAITMGPTFAGDGVAPFQHWTLGVGGRISELGRHVYVCGQFGLLWESRPALSVGERVAVAVPETGATPQPLLPTETTFQFTMGVALVVDVQVIGTVVNAIVGAAR